MASNIIKMVLKLDDQASGELNKTSKSADGASKSFMATKINAKQAAAGIGLVAIAAAAAGKAYVDMGRDWANSINVFNDMSTSTGLTVATLENLNLMASSTGVNLKGMERGLVSFSKSLGEAKDGTGTLSKALERLELDPNQFTDADDALKTVLKSISEYGDQADRARLLNEAFGIAAKDMVKVMQTGFDDAGKALDVMNLRIGESAEEAKKSQKAIALFDLVLATVKRKAFETFLGPGGFAAGVAGVVAVVRMLEDLVGNLVGGMGHLFETVYRGHRALIYLAKRELDMAERQAEKGKQAYIDFGESVVNLTLLSPFEAAAKGAVDFQEAMANLEGTVDENISLMAELEKVQGELGDGGAEGVTALTTAITEQEQAAIDAARTLEDLWGAANSLIPPMSEAEQALRGMVSAEDMGAFAGQIEQLGRSFVGLSQFEGLELDADIAEARQLHELMAATLLAMGEMTAQGLVIPDNMRDLLDTLKSQIEGATLDLEIDAAFAEDAIRVARIEADRLDADRISTDRLEDQEQIAGTIGAITGAVSSAASGDIAGAAQGIGTALGASPIFGAIVGGLGAIAEIGKMTAREIKQNAVAFVDNLIAGFEVLIEALPDLVTMLVSRLPIAIINGMFTLIPSLIAELPAAIFAGFVKALTSIGGAFFGGKTAASDEAIAALAWREEREREHQEGLSSTFAMGSAKIQRTGRAIVHRGETIIPAGGRAAQDRMTTGGGITVNISTAILDRDVIPRLVREIDRAVGTYGRTSAAFAGS